MFKSIWYSVCRFWFRQKLKWQFKGDRKDFDNFLEFQGLDYFEKITAEYPTDPEWLKIKQRALHDSEYREKNFSGWKTQIEEFRATQPMYLRSKTELKSVRETIMASIEECKQ